MIKPWRCMSRRAGYRRRLDVLGERQVAERRILDLAIEASIDAWPGDAPWPTA